MHWSPFANLLESNNLKQVVMALKSINRLNLGEYSTGLSFDGYLVSEAISLRLLRVGFKPRYRFWYFK